MTLHLELPPDIEQALRARAAAEGKAVDAFVAEVVAEQLASPTANLGGPQPSERPAKRFDERLQAWIDLHPRSGRPVDDSRESIYAGRGE